jgi:hypothetical protein
MNRAIQAALVTQYNSAAIGDETNGLWFQEVPRKDDGQAAVHRPYTVFEFTAETTSAMTPTRRPNWENVDVLFSICSSLKSPVEVTTLFNLLTDLFDPLDDINAANYTTIRIDRTGQELVPDPDKGWVYEVSYRFVLENDIAD